MYPKPGISHFAVNNFTNLIKDNFGWWYGFQLEPIFANVQDTPTRAPYFKNGQKWPKHLHSFYKVES